MILTVGHSYIPYIHLIQSLKQRKHFINVFFSGMETIIRLEIQAEMVKSASLSMERPEVRIKDDFLSIKLKQMHTPLIFIIVYM